ncbi:MAG: hypothetical protein HQ515_10555 [Phycisphaeraceae bacterium]|nr:hypothetical protein [Phycisphaeraceae bacterium]
MRIVTAIGIWVVILGSLTSFQHHRERLRASQATRTQPVTTSASAVYSLAVTPTFKAEPDPFALQTDTTVGAAALVVRMTGTDLLRVADQVEAGQAVHIKTLPRIKVGLNEIYIEGSPPTAQGQQRHAVLVELFRNDVWIQQASFWSVPGGKVTGVLRFEVAENEGEESDHDH